MLFTIASVQFIFLLSQIFLPAIYEVRMSAKITTEPCETAAAEAKTAKFMSKNLCLQHVRGSSRLDLSGQEGLEIHYRTMAKVVTVVYMVISIANR